MKWPKFGRKDKTIDFTSVRYSNMPHKSSNIQDTVDLRNTSTSSQQDVNSNTTNEPSNSGGFDFLNTMASSSTTQNDTSSLMNNSELSELKSQMRNITGKIEDSSNEVYRLMHRIELLEAKISRFESRGSF